MVLTSEINIKATSSIELCSSVLSCALQCSPVLSSALLCSPVLSCALHRLHDNRTQITWIIFKNSSAVMCIFLKLFVHELLYKFIDSIDLKWCIGHWFTHPIIKKLVLTSELNIIATSSIELCSPVLFCALLCSPVLSCALLCSPVLSFALHRLTDNRTQINWIIFKNSTAVMCIFFKLFVHELHYEFIDSIDLKCCVGHWFTHPIIKKWFEQVK